MKDYLPLLFLLVCPVAMLWMMRGMHGSGSDRTDTEPDPRIAMLEDQVARLQAVVPPNVDVPAARVPGHEKAEGTGSFASSAPPSRR